MSYEPRGRAADLIAALRAEPRRLFTVAETAAMLNLPAFPSAIANRISTAAQHRVVFRINIRGEWLYAGQEINDDMLVASGRAPRSTSGGMAIIASPFTDEDRERAQADPRAPGPIGYVPTPMSPPRAGSEFKIQRFLGATPRATSAPTPAPTPAPAPIEQMSTVESQEQLERTIADANVHLNEKLRKRLAESAALRRQPEPEGDPAEAADPADEPAVEAEAEEEVEFNASRWLDGDIVIYGVAQNEDGSFTLSAQQFEQLRAMVPEVRT